MPGLWNIVVPEATTNLISYPSLELETGAATGWVTLGGGVLTQSTDDQVFGLYSLKDVPTAGTTDGSYPTAFSATNTVTYTASLYFKGAVGIPYKLNISNAGSTNISTKTEITGDGEWHRYENTYTAEATESLYVTIRKDNSADTDPFYVDGVQVEAKAYATTYCDGDQKPSTDYSWSGVHHASTSSRIATSRAGGRIKNLRDDYYFYVGQTTGTGAPPVTNYYTDYALLPGALYEHAKIRGRLFILNGLLKGTSLSNLHARRAALYNVLRPDETASQPVLIQYTGAAETMEIEAYYDGGMEGGILEGFNERIGVRFYCPQPNWREVVT